MLVVAVIRSERLPLLQEAIAEHNQFAKIPWGCSELERFRLGDITVSRIALVTDKPPPDDKEMAIEAVIDQDYCAECLKSGIFKKLKSHNHRGYCFVHRDKNPERTARKLKKY